MLKMCWEVFPPSLFSESLCRITILFFFFPPPFWLHVELPQPGIKKQSLNHRTVRTARETLALVFKCERDCSFQFSPSLYKMEKKSLSQDAEQSKNTVQKGLEHTWNSTQCYVAA